MSEHASVAAPSYGFVFSKNGVEVKSCRVHGLPNVDNTEQEATHHGSPNGMKEFKLTLGEMAVADMEIDYDDDDATHRALYRAALLRQSDTYSREFPDMAISVSGTGYIRNWKWGSMTPEQLQRATFTFRESPAWDWDTAVPA